MPKDEPDNSESSRPIDLTRRPKPKAHRELHPAAPESNSNSHVHIRTRKVQEALHRIGDQELYGPDYHLLCAFAEESKCTPKETLDELLGRKQTLSGTRRRYAAEIVDGRFSSLSVFASASSFPSIQGLTLTRLCLRGWNSAKIDLNPFPHLNTLECSSDQLTEIDLSQVPNLTSLSLVGGNQLRELELSPVPHLLSLTCISERLTRLDLTPVPNLTSLTIAYGLNNLDLSPVPRLTSLKFDSAKPVGTGWRDYRTHYFDHFTTIDLRPVPELRSLSLHSNRITKLDLKPVRKLESLECHLWRLEKLDLRPVPNLTSLGCWSDRLTKLNLKPVPNLKSLDCRCQRLKKLNLKPLRHLEKITKSFIRRTTLIQRHDQNF